jgi:hypothetical protein
MLSKLKSHPSSGGEEVELRVKIRAAPPAEPGNPQSAAELGTGNVVPLAAIGADSGREPGCLRSLEQARA